MGSKRSGVSSYGEEHKNIKKLQKEREWSAVMGKKNCFISVYHHSLRTRK